MPAPLAKGAEKRYASAERRLRWEPRRDWEPLTLVRLQKHQCKFIVAGDGADSIFCGEARLADRSYCPRHYAICTTSPRRLTVAG
jgi:hypothetical protein